jgi:hypothetical protein
LVLTEVAASLKLFEQILQAQMLTTSMVSRFRSPIWRHLPVKTSLLSFASALGLLGGVFGFSPAQAAYYNLEIKGADAIFLSGRSDLTIPDVNQPWDSGDYLGRHPFDTPEELADPAATKEKVPPFIPVSGGDIVKVRDPVSGGINFFIGFDSQNYFGPDGNGLDGSNLEGLGGISAYVGPQGPLVGVFLNDDIPDGTTTGQPPALNFTSADLGIDFTYLEPQLRQVFYIGNGVTSSSIYQQFLAPTGATRLFLGIADGFGFVGHPGAYDDNDGSYFVAIGVNQEPVPAPLPVLGSLAVIGKCRRLAHLSRRLKRSRPS